jgi:hypothetical protein
LLRDVIEDDDGVGDIVVPIAREVKVVVVLAALREEEEEEDGLECFAMLHTPSTHAAPLLTGERNVSRFPRAKLSLVLCLSVCL